MVSDRAMTPDDLYRAARFTDCLLATEGDTRTETLIARARCFIALDRSEEALAELSLCNDANGDLAATILALRSRACVTLERWDVADAWLRVAGHPKKDLTAIGRSEIAIARGIVAMHRGLPTVMRDASRTIEMENAGPRYHAWQLHILAWSYAYTHEYRKMATLLQELSTFMLGTPAATDVMLLARSARALGVASREMFSMQLYESVIELFERIPWTVDLEMYRLIVKRCMVWTYALHGSERVAHHLMFELIDELPTPALRPILYADQAYLMYATGNDEVAAPLLTRAIEYACQISWDSSGEQRVALLNLVVLAAQRDTVSARMLMNIYDGFSTVIAANLLLAHDGRLQAFVSHARGSLLRAEGNGVEAERLLRMAFNAFHDFEHAWRAASVALELHALTSDPTWLQKAESAVLEFPQSAIAREIRRRAGGAKDSRLAALSPAQRRVFELLCGGKSNKEIASALKISINTARNHVAAVLARFGAHSRAHLAAVAHESGLL